MDLQEKVNELELEIAELRVELEQITEFAKWMIDRVCKLKLHETLVKQNLQVMDMST